MPEWHPACSAALLVSSWSPAEMRLLTKMLKCLAMGITVNDPGL